MANSAFTGSSGGGGGGGLVFISEVDITSSTATADFTSGIGASYDAYKFVVSTITPVTDAAELEVRLSVGAVFQTGSTAYNWSFSGRDTQTNSVTVGDASDLWIDISENSGSATNETGSYSFDLMGVNNTTYSTMICGTGAYFDSSGRSTNISISGALNAASAVDGLRFLFSSGNIENAQIQMFGYAKS